MYIFEIRLWLLVKISSRTLLSPFLVVLVPSVTFCRRLRSDATLINCHKDMSLYLPSGITDPIPAFQLALGKLKSPVSIMSGIGALYLPITLYILSITIFLKDSANTSP